MRVLIVEDDKKIASFIVKGLGEAGFAVDHASSGEDGLHLAVTTAYDALVVDIMLPGVDGLSLIRQLREKGINTPVIILSAKRSVEDRVKGLRTGSDDYLTKPFSFSELLARVQALIRRSGSSTETAQLKFSGVSLDIYSREVVRGGKKIDLQPREGTDTCREALSDCMEESGQIISMLNTLMDISEAETGVMRLNLQKINISSLIAKVVDLYRYVAEERDITILVNMPEDIALEADPVRLKQVIANLLDNAIKYTTDGSSVSIKAAAGADHIRVTVEDSGMGITKEELPKIWDRLYRGKNALSRKGLGLGLSLVRAVVHAHKGHIDVSGKEGEGAAFTIYLPV